MRIFFLISLFFILGKIEAQTENINHRRVLVTDSGEVYGKKFPAMAFGGSYFVCSHQYGSAFSDQEFNDFVLKTQNFSSDITAYKSSDNKGLVCIFPKSALRGISSLTAFINSNFASSFASNLLFVKTTHIEVVRTFDPLDIENEKGFNHLTN